MTTETLGAAMSGSLAAHHALHAFAHAIDVRLAHLGKERQRDRLPRDALRDREHALAESLVAEERGEVDRFVGNTGSDAFLLHRVHERLAGAAQRLQRQQHREHVPAVSGVVARRQALGREEVVAREALEVAMREPRAGAAPFVQVRELLQAESRRNVGEVVLDPGALHVARAVGQARSTTLPVAKKLCAGMMTSSPGSMPSSSRATCIAAVAEVSARTGRPPKRSDSAFSNAATRGPVAIQRLRSVSETAAIMASSMVGRAKGRKFTRSARRETRPRR